MSQPPYPPAAAPQGPGLAPPSPATPPPAAPTQVGFPGQFLAAQPQYAAPPQPAEYATGFPNYVSPPPSPKNQTSAIVGAAVCLAVLLFAVIGFVLVA
ncbi:hypothetical protein [Geodermatophilus sp. SYSU D00815]